MIDASTCIGCQACVDICPVQAISFEYNLWGEGKAIADRNKCINCGFCDRVCPGKNQIFNQPVNNVFAVTSKVNSNRGSSGGFFYELASAFIEHGGIVYGAAFDKGLKLKHMKATCLADLIRLCKSKYIHSDMFGTYHEIKSLLHDGKEIMFVGTPCQTSAIKNLFEAQYEKKLLLVDFLCHGTGTQKVFDACITDEQIRKCGRIVEFYFRSKSRKAEHSFSYVLDQGNKKKNVSGYSFEFSYYNAFLSYSIFQDACYHCPYAKPERVGDITLGDFWGIQKYDQKLKDYEGVSMISINTNKGNKWFHSVAEKCNVSQYPIICAIDNNQSFSSCVKYPDRKTYLVNILSEKGEEALVAELKCPHILKSKLYAKTPSWAIRLYHWMRGRT